MAFPVAKFYSCPSGGVIAGGRTARKSGDIIVVGDSLTVWTPGWTWGLALARAPNPMIYNAGVVANAIGDLDARWDADVTAKNPSIVMLRIGTNSLSLGTSEFRAGYQSILNKVLASNLYCFVHAIPPRQSDTTGAALGHNIWLAAQCAANPSKLCYVDDSSGLGPAGGSYDASYVGDGTHLTPKGMHSQGVAMAPVLAQKMAPNDCRTLLASDTYEQNPATSTQWVRNPTMTGGGSLPAYWNVAGATSSIVSADVGDAVQIPWLRSTISSTGAENSEVVIYTSLIHPAIDADLTIKRLDMVIEMRLNALSGAAIKSIRMQCSGDFVRPGPLAYLEMPGDEVLTHTLIFRSAIARGDTESLHAHTANSLSFGLSLISRGTMSGTLGSVDIRCASVRPRGN